MPSGRLKRTRDSRSARIAEMALVPVDHGALTSRIHRHMAYMNDLMSQGLGYHAMPKAALAEIVRDFQIAGLDVPTSALRAVSRTTHRQPPPPYRPAPLSVSPLPQTTRGPEEESVSLGDPRAELIQRGFDPKIGMTRGGAKASAASSMPYVGRSASSLPYTATNRYTILGDKASLTAEKWLPPWMVYGDQPNQFVKTPAKPMSMGIAAAGPASPFISSAAQAHRARQQAGIQEQLPYVGRNMRIGEKLVPFTQYAASGVKRSRDTAVQDVLEDVGKVGAASPARRTWPTLPVEEVPASGGEAEEDKDLIDLNRASPPFPPPAKRVPRRKAQLTEESKRRARAEEEYIAPDLIDLNRASPPFPPPPKRVRTKAALQESTRKVSAIEEHRPRRKAQLTEESKQRARAEDEYIAPRVTTLPVYRVPPSPRPGPKRRRYPLQETTRKVQAEEEDYVPPAARAILDVARSPNTPLAKSVREELEEAANELQGSPPKKNKREKKAPAKYSPKKLGGSPKKSVAKSASEKAHKLAKGRKKSL